MIKKKKEQEKNNLHYGQWTKKQNTTQQKYWLAMKDIIYTYILQNNITI